MIINDNSNCLLYRLECTISANQDTINCQEETISGLETNCSDLRNDVLLMEEKLESAKRSHQKSFIECNESFDEVAP